MYKITHYKVHDNKGAHYKTTTNLLDAWNNSDDTLSSWLKVLVSR